MQVECALGEFGDLGEAAGYRQFRHRVCPQIFDQSAGEIAHVEKRDLRQIVERLSGSLRGGAGRAEHVVEPGRAIAGPSTQTLYTVGTVKDVTIDGGKTRRYISVDGGMSSGCRSSGKTAAADSSDSLRKRIGPGARR